MLLKLHVPPMHLGPPRHTQERDPVALQGVCASEVGLIAWEEMAAGGRAGE